MSLKLNGQYFSFFLNYTIQSHNLVLLLMKKRTLLSKILAVSVLESKRVSCFTQLSLQALVGHQCGCPRKSVSAEQSKTNKLFKVQKLTWKNSKKAFEDSWVWVYSFGQWPKCLKKKNLLRKFSRIWYCREVPFQVWKSGLSRNFLAKVKSDPELNM